ncbi:MAG: metallophosphoesterase [Planctomycetes bacterium]|nr:metallophosphoesterase [Planctomycetota bacterium]
MLRRGFRIGFESPRRSVLPALFLALAIGTPCPAGEEAEEAWTFVSIPDFLNVDLDYPQPTWEDALDFVLDAVRAEGPDFALVAGDLVMGRWWEGPEQIDRLAERYYSAWIQRMRDHDLTFYAAVGDHELGDNPWPPERLKLVPHFEAAFAKYLGMPQNGPPRMRGLAYSLLHKGCLVVAVDVFEERMSEGRGTATVTGEQLEWLDQTLAQREGVEHVVVMGHTPILGPVRARSSSRLMLEGGRRSPLWQTLKKHQVDLYLCGEVHAITCIEADGVEQIAHGSLFGYVDTVNYLVATVTPEEMRLELKRLDIILEGGELPQSAGNRPREIVRISPEQNAAGFRSVGAMTIDKREGEPRHRDRTGEFTTLYEPSKSGERAAVEAKPVDVAARIKSLAATAPAGARLAAYLDCGPQTKSTTPADVRIKVVRGGPFVFGASVPGVAPSEATIAFDAEKVVVEIDGLRPDRRYVAGMTWWDFGARNRTQTVTAASPDGNETEQVVPATRLPNYRFDNRLPERRRFDLPTSLFQDGRLQLTVAIEQGANAVLSELWVWEVRGE